MEEAMKRLGAVLVCAVALLLWAGIPAGAQESSASQTTTTTTTRTTKKAARTSGKIDINSATKEELEALPGIGPATSQKIIDSRPYSAKSDLVKNKIVSATEYAKFKNSIVAHRTSATK